MWKISSEAMTYLATQQVQEITIDEPVSVSGCCIPVSVPPQVRIGQVQQPEFRQPVQAGVGCYVALEVEGIKLNIPSYLAGLELTIDLSRFFRRKKLVIEGWNPV